MSKKHKCCKNCSTITKWTWIYCPECGYPQINRYLAKCHSFIQTFMYESGRSGLSSLCSRLIEYSVTAMSLYVTGTILTGYTDFPIRLYLWIRSYLLK